MVPLAELGSVELEGNVDVELSPPGWCAHGGYECVPPDPTSDVALAIGAESDPVAEAEAESEVSSVALEEAVLGDATALTEADAESGSDASEPDEDDPDEVDAGVAFGRGW